MGYILFSTWKAIFVLYFVNVKNSRADANVLHLPALLQVPLVHCFSHLQPLILSFLWDPLNKENCTENVKNRSRDDLVEAAATFTEPHVR